MESLERQILFTIIDTNMNPEKKRKKLEFLKSCQRVKEICIRVREKLKLEHRK